MIQNLLTFTSLNKDLKKIRNDENISFKLQSTKHMFDGLTVVRSTTLHPLILMISLDDLPMLIAYNCASRFLEK